VVICALVKLLVILKCFFVLLLLHLSPPKSVTQEITLGIRVHCYVVSSGI
jgi:hypothetical protein